MCRPGKILRHLDPAWPLLLHTDWSQQGIGAVLGQVDDGSNEYMGACISRSLNKHERNYGSYAGELLGCVWAIKTMRPLLHGRKFTVVTYHRPLQWLMTAKDLTGKYARWSLSLQEYDFDVKYREGVKHQNADGLSRLPLESSLDVTGARLDDDEPAAASVWLAEPQVPGRAAALACCPDIFSDADVLLYACTVGAEHLDSGMVSSPNHLLQAEAAPPEMSAPVAEDCTSTALETQTQLARWAIAAVLAAGQVGESVPPP
jgi:hypothetical protein